MSERILVLNVGSSSLRVAAFERPTRAAVLVAMVERIGAGEALLRLERQGGAPPRVEPVAARDHEQALGVLLARLEREGLSRAGVVAVGHRVVHGGERYAAPVGD